MAKYMPSETSQEFAKKIYGNELLDGELRWLAIKKERTSDLIEARKFWPKEKNVGRLLRMYCIKKGKQSIRFFTRRSRMVDIKVSGVQERRKAELIQRLRERFGDVPILNPDAMTEQEKEVYLREHSEISKKLPMVPCPKPECDGMMTVGPICGSCKEAKGERPGVRYRTKWVCMECGHSERSTKSLGAWVKELGKRSKVEGQDGS